MLKNKKGVALVYVLMALVFVGAVGMLVLNMANKEKTDSGLRVSTEVARYSATAGLTFAASWFTNPANAAAALGVLNQWRAVPVPEDRREWIVGTANTFEEVDGMRFRVRIVNMDFSNLRNVSGQGATVPRDNSFINIMFESESIDQSGSRARNLGTYRLFGYELAQIQPPFEWNALYLGRNMDEINVQLTVNGATFIQGGGLIHRNNHIFNGEFRRRGRNNITIRGARFRGPAYFGAIPGETTTINVEPAIVGTTELVFERGLGTGIGSNFVTTGTVTNPTAPPATWIPVLQPVIRGGAFLAGNWDARASVGGWINFSRITEPPFNNILTQLRWRANGVYRSGTSPIINGIERLYLGGVAPEDTLSVAEPTEPDIINFLRQFGNIAQNDPPTLTINNIPAPFTISETGVRGARLNAIFDSLVAANSQHIIQDERDSNWMVVRVAPSGLAFNSDLVNGEGFRRRMVLILNQNNIQYGRQVFATDPNSPGNSLIILTGNTTVNQFGNNSLIRGLIVNAGTGNINLGVGIRQGNNPNANPGANTNTMTIRGAVYSPPPVAGGANSSFRLEGCGWPHTPAIGPNCATTITCCRLTIQFDQEALREIELLGIINLGGGGAAVPEFRPIPNDRPNTRLLSRSF